MLNPGLDVGRGLILAHLVAKDPRTLSDAAPSVHG